MLALAARTGDWSGALALADSNAPKAALATAAAFGFYALYVDHGLPWALAGALIVLVLAPLVGIALEILARALASKSLAVRVGSTVGLLLIVQAVIGLAYGTTEENTFPHYLSQASVTIGGAAVTVEDDDDLDRSVGRGDRVR